MPKQDARDARVSAQDCVNRVNLPPKGTGPGAAQLRTSVPGRAPVSASFSRIITPLQNVAA
ncbi:hypothetical protein NSE01_11330 [Novosphingobium sediminis]|uniref:Uncharacterized protein n=1 Tax=Novosphingobium sediminis TaxID=707214 RepID=A0A512AHV6_9SPHN|nr:hypothetical protein NSE01_11330 [Novosphingobium sediminis]